MHVSKQAKKNSVRNQIIGFGIIKDMILLKMNIPSARVFNSRIIVYNTFTRFKSDVRVRFAPSPTGHLHLGGLRTALYNYIFAKQNDGAFVLRIEDTDRTRLVPGSAEQIEQLLCWAGLKPDESPKIGGPFGPYNQSQRLDLYKKKVDELVAAGKAYRCFCTPTRLELLRKHQARNREKLRYDRRCLSLSKSEIEEKLVDTGNNYVVRFTLQPGATTFTDTVFGDITNDLIESQESDPVIIKSDGFPTYHFANVIDDHSMRISHVLRGAEWISSTCKHVQIYEAFQWQQPKFLHFPLITMKDGTKMSKRNDNSHLKSWIDAGYRPLPILNFLTNSGGGVPKSKQDSNEFWTLDRMVKDFRFNSMTTHSASIDVGRLKIYSQKELQKRWADNQVEVIEELKELIKRANLTCDLDDENLASVLDKYISRITLLNDLISSDKAFIWGVPKLDWSLDEYTGFDMRSIIEGLIELVREVDINDQKMVDSSFASLANKYKIDKRILFRLSRKLLTNSDAGLPVQEIFALLGKERLRTYLNHGLDYVCNQ